MPAGFYGHTQRGGRVIATGRKLPCVAAVTYRYSPSDPGKQPSPVSREAMTCMKAQCCALHEAANMQTPDHLSADTSSTLSQGQSARCDFLQPLQSRADIDEAAVAQQRQEGLPHRPSWLERTPLPRVNTRLRRYRTQVGGSALKTIKLGPPSFLMSGKARRLALTWLPCGVPDSKPRLVSFTST